MIDISEARAHVLERCPPAGLVAVPCRQSTGLVLAAPVVAAEDVPPFANSAVDGYAVVAASVTAASREVPVHLPVVGEVAAGASSDRVLQSGEAIRIMTGAPVPAGADAIVMVEDTERVDGDRVAIRRSTSVGAAVRPRGDDVLAGTTLYGAGTMVTPTVAGVLASVNAATVQVVPRVRVAVLSTGDELIEDGSVLQPGQIRESNRTMLLGLVRAAGCDAVDFGIVRDDEAELEHVLLHKAATECDAIVTSGGVSMGDYDVVKAVLSRIADMRWMQIAIRPAKPFAFGLLDSGGRKVPVFGLPGNPVSSIVSFELLARPALLQMMGHTTIDRPQVQAIADSGLPRRPDGKTHYVRVFATFGDDGRVHVESVGSQGSHQLAATSLAKAIAVVGDGAGVAPGAAVTTMLLSFG